MKSRNRTEYRIPDEPEELLEPEDLPRLVDVGDGRHLLQRLGANSIEHLWLEFWLGEKNSILVGNCLHKENVKI